LQKISCCDDGQARCALSPLAIYDKNSACLLKCIFDRYANLFRFV
jgi:hypothetical protein